MTMSPTERTKQWRKDNPEKYKALRQRRQKNHSEVNNKHSRESHARARARLREEAIQALGGKCSQCGISDVRCLEIDHIIPIRTPSGKRMELEAFYRGIINGDRENVQILCANCHAIKTRFEGYK